MSAIGLWRRLLDRPGPDDRLRPEETRAVVEAIRRLNQGLGGDRRLAGRGYMDDPELLGAYLLLFAPISAAQLKAILRRTPPARRARALDLGCGPGPLSRVLLEGGVEQVWAGDASPDALALARRVCDSPDLRTFPWQPGAPLPEGRFDLIVLGHVLNELWRGAGDRAPRRAALLEELAARLAPGGRLVVLEPARHVINRDLLEVRDLIRAAPIVAPCFRAGPCPSRAEGAVCHNELAWSPPPLVEALARAAQLDKSTLAYSWLVLGPPGEPGAPTGPVRVVSERLRNKAGRERLVVCGEAGRFSLSAPPDARGYSWSALWSRIGRGDALRVVAPEVRESGWGLGPASALTLQEGVDP